MKNHFIALTIIIVTLNAYSSEFFHQPSGGEFELTPALQYQSFDIKYKNTTAINSAKFAGWMPSVRSDYGLTGNYSLGATLSYVSSEMTVEPSSASANTTTSGLANPELLFMGYNDLGPGSIHYGAIFSLSLEKNKSDTRDHKSNAATGGNTLMPYVGYAWNGGSFVLGARVAYELYKGERESENTASNGTVSTTKTKAGESTYFHLFGEIPLSDCILGLALFYTDSVETKTSTNGAAEQNNRNSSQSYAGQLYANIPVSGVELLPSFVYGQHNLSNGNYSQYIDTTSIMQIKIGARFGF